jgi:hypothetical protein
MDVRSRSVPVLAALLIAGCGGDAAPGADADAAPDAAVAQVSDPQPDDPCNLVAQAEMERYMGPLAEPPFRADDREPDPEGTQCFYRAKDGRNVTLDVDRVDGELGFRMLVGVGGQVEEALAGADMSTDTLEVEWDRVGRAFGQLIALKGPASVQVDPLGSRLDLAAQADIIRIALARLDAPLPYDGAGAARNRTAPPPKRRDPCTLVTRAEAEALLGKLRAAPHISEEGDACVFPLAMDFMGTPVDQELQVQWHDGFYALGQERGALGMATKVMTNDMGDIPSLGENTAGEAEPWDERITLIGGVVTVVKHDVLLKIAANGVGGFDEAKALTLLRLAAGRL